MSLILQRPQETHGVLAISLVTLALATTPAGAQDKKPNIVMLMTDDTGWNDFGAYGGGANLGHPTPNVDRIAQEGAVFTSWYGQAVAPPAAPLHDRAHPHPFGALSGGCAR